MHTSGSRASGSAHRQHQQRPWRCSRALEVDERMTHGGGAHDDTRAVLTCIHLHTYTRDLGAFTFPA